jgi:glyoxylase-like metal-dependent hydrolase (beta-lactamase superfamily II)
MNRRDFLYRSGAVLALGLLPRGPLFAQTTATPPAGAPPVKPPTPVTEFKPLRRNTGLFTGRGGTIGWLVSPEAVVAVDTQFPDTAALFLAGLPGLPGRSGRTLDAVIDSHHHWDHTGGNKVFKPAARMIVGQQNVPGLQAAAFARNPQMGEQTPPDTLFADSWRMEAGDEVITARHFGPAHTGGDIVVHFEKANVIHLGDLVFNRIHPVTDRPGGCSVRNWIKVLEKVAETYPADALYIFGHGRPSLGVTGHLGDVLAMRDFLTALVTHVERQIAAGQPRAEIVKLVNLPGFPDYDSDPKTSRLPGNLGAVYDELTGDKA